MPVARTGLRFLLSSAGAAVKLGWDAARLQLVAITCLSVIEGAVPVAAAWSLRLLLDSMSGDPISQSAISLAVGGIVLCGFLAVAGQAGQAYLQTVMQRSIRTIVEARLFRAIHAVHGLSAFEDSRKLDQIRLAEQAGESAPEE